MGQEISIVVMNHGSFGTELIKSAELIVGKIENIKSVSLVRNMSIQEYYQAAKETILEMKNDKVILLTDLFGGTPSNVSIILQQELGAKVMCGVNLPMLIELVTNLDSGKDIDKLLEQILSVTKDSIRIPDNIEINEE